MRKALVILCCISLVLPTTLNAATGTTALPDGIDLNLLLSDNDMFDPNGLSRAGLTNFLRSKGTLADARLPDIDGIVKPAPEIIWRVAQSYKINPKYLLVLIQKEQSLVEDRSPSSDQLDWAAGYGVCDSCSKNDPSIQEFKGFASQIEWAAKQHREKYLIQLLSRGLTIGGQGIGRTVNIDGVPVTPANHATAMLYSYTPHIRGNVNLWNIWKRWFSAKFPEGSVVRSLETDTTYLIRFGTKRPFASPAVLASMTNESKVLEAHDRDLANYSDGDPLKFPTYSLLREPSGKIYLLTSDSKRHIETMVAFKKFGFNEDEIVDVEKNDLDSYPEGTAITQATEFPQGVLMKAKGSSGVWYVEDGKRHALVDAVFISLYFRGRRILNVSKNELDKYEEGEKYALHDGELVKSADDPSVYVIENGLRRPILSGEVFEKVGWKWKNIVTVPDRVLSIHQLGEPFRVQTEQQLAAGD